MSDRVNDAQYSAHSKSAAEIDIGLRNYMLRVYNYMAIALGVTGLFAYGIYSVSFETIEGSVVGLTPLGSLLFESVFKWVVMFAPLGFIMMMGARVTQMSLGKARFMLWTFAALMGVSLSAIFAVYTSSSINQVFFITAAAFAGLSLYGYTTPKSLSSWGSFLMMGLIGLIIASIVNLFLGSSALEFAISGIGVLVFAGFTAYDTQSIREMYDVSDDGEVSGKKAVFGALSLYLDFVNLFMLLLHLFGDDD